MATTPASTGAAAPSTMLAHVRYFIDSSVQEGVKSKLVDLLHAHSAQPCLLASSFVAGPSSSPSTAFTTSFDLEDVTHVISLTSTFLGYQAVEEYNRVAAENAKATGSEATTAPTASGTRGELIAVVSPKWLTRSSDLNKRQEEQFFSPDPKMIFSGVVVCTEDLPQGDSETIKGVVAALGGQWRQALMIEVTHLICTKPKGRKFERLMSSAYRLGMKAILPHWFDDCIKLQQRVKEDDYLFPDPPCLATTLAKPKPYLKRLQTFLKLPQPPVLQYSATSAILDPHVSEKGTQAYLDTLARKQQILDENRPSSSGVFKGKKVYVAESCDLGDERLKTFGTRIQEAGGTWVKGQTQAARVVALKKADYVVTNHRNGWEFWQAHDAGKTIGNLDWLIYILFGVNKSSSVALSSPMDRLLHYPWPSSPLEQFKNYNITISGYTGTARESMKKMIELLGGKFEGTMTKNRTTHVIASSLSGSKVQHAQMWDVPVLNHFWIEDCFLSWSCRNNVNSQYVNFDAGGTDYASLVGTRTISPKVVEDWAKREENKAERSQALAEVQTAPVNGEDTEMTETLQSNGAPEHETPPNPKRKKATLPAKESFFVSESVLRMEPERPSESVESELEMNGTTTMDVDTPNGHDYHAQDNNVMLDDGGAPQASENPEAEEEAVEKALLEKPRRLLKEKSPLSTSTPNNHPAQSAKPPLEPPSSASTIDVAKPAATKMKRKRSDLSMLQKENSFGFTPQIYSGRKAAAAAQKKLHDTIMPDANRFAEEQRGGGKKRLDDMFGSAGPSEEKTRRDSTSSSVKKPRRDARKSSASEESEQVDDDGLPDVPRPTNGAAKGKQVRVEAPLSPEAGPSRSKGKGRVGALKQQAEPSRSQISSDYSSFDAPPGKKHHPVLAPSKVVAAGGIVKIARTGAELGDAMQKILVKTMGAQMLGDDLTGATHIVVKAISRTPKFLQAISMGLYFVTEQWAIDSINQGQFLDETKYLLKDKTGEDNHNMNLARSVAKARQRKVFDDQTFYLTPNVQPAFEALKSIAEAGGAKVIKKLPTLKLVQDRADVYVMSSLDESGSWKHLADNGVLVYSGEAIIKAAMQQTIKFEDFILSA